MLRLLLHEDALKDLASLRAVDIDAWATVVAILQEIEGSQDLLDRLTQNGFSDARLDVKLWSTQQYRHGRNLWRLRLFDLDELGFAYRVVYAFAPLKHTYHVLAVAPRSFDYQPSHDLTKRILAAYDNLY